LSRRMALLGLVSTENPENTVSGATEIAPPAATRASDAP